MKAVSRATQIKVIDVDKLISGGSREALDQALEKSQRDIESLRSQLAALDIDVADEVIDRAVATQSLSEGNLTVFVD